ncbi:hypothetical protein [Streptomyces sp. DHE17-7]|uniref:hypothetical protein n=1 Tax=Streptomyces sp. DHE17-7 TaxID=2759949 RepID=UPI003FA75082
MEDAATAEISRSQIWQWINAGVVLDNGERVTAELARKVAAEDWRTSAPRSVTRPSRNWQQAHDLLLTVSLDEDYADFLTLPAYEQLKG